MTEVRRRTVLGGAAMSMLAGGATSQPVEDMTLLGAGGMAGVLTAPTLERLRDMPAPAPGTLVLLDEPGRRGLFVCRQNINPADPLQGLFVRSTTSGRCYERLWDGVHGRPEWFGARVNDGRFDCAAAIEACHALCAVTVLAQSDYFVGRTVRFGQSWRTIRGTGTYATDERRGTRIILQSQAPGVGRDDIVQIGSPTKPIGSPDRFPTQIHLANVTLIRDGAAAPHSSGDLARYPAGLRLSYVQWCTVREVSSLESSVGFYIGGTVYSKVDDCVAQRVRAGSGGGPDYWCGFYLDGRPALGYAGGNASIYLNRCLAVEQNAAHVDAVGLRAEGAFVDSFLDQFESARIATGMSFRAAGARAVGQTVDLHVRNPVLDACTAAGIEVELDATSSASIEIVDPYIYAAGGGGRAGISVANGAGLCTITGGQVHGEFAQGSLRFARTRGVRVQGTKIQQAIRPVVVEEASALVLEPQISNASKAASGFAISCRRLVRSVIRPTVIGYASPAFAGGVELDASSNYSQIDGSAIDPGCFRQADAALKVQFGGRDARNNAAFTAAGNVLVGVTG